MRPKTKTDKFMEKLIDLTAEGLIPWVEVKGNYDYPIGFKASTPAGSFTIVLRGGDQCLIVKSNNEEFEYSYSDSNPFLPDLIRAARDYLFTPWPIETIMRNVLEGALDEDSKRVDDTV
jgi:hypothetical protein